jgi:hypothetical protein
MTTLVIIICIIALLVWLGRLWRKRELAKFRDVDAGMLQELRQQHPNDTETSGPLNLNRQSATTDLVSSDAPDTDPAKTEQRTPSNLPVLKSRVIDPDLQLSLEQLERVVGDAYRLLVNVPLVDVLTTHHEGQVSLLLCDKVSAEPVLAIEFASRFTPGIGELLQQAGLPLLKIDIGETETHLQSRLMAMNASWVVSSAPANSCPNCQGEMSLKAPKTGKNAGKRFWLCRAYPGCQGVIPA